MRPLRLAYPALEPLPLPQRERVRLSDDWDHVDLVVDGLHELDVQGLQPWGGEVNVEGRTC